MLTEYIISENIDQIVSSLNVVKRTAYQGEILPFIFDLWIGNEQKYPDLPWRIVKKDMIRVELADVLVDILGNNIVR